MKANKSSVLRSSIINALMRWIPAPQRRGERRENPESHLSSLAGSISAPPQRALRLCGAPMLLGVFCLLLWTLAPAQVPYKRIANADAEPGDWLTYSGAYHSQRFSKLAQITPANVGGLKTAWVYQFKQPGRQETSPVVVDGVMYISESPTIVTALDARTGRTLWTWRRNISRLIKTIGFGQSNRGVAILDDTVYVGTLDCYLVALDAKTGAVRWETKVENNATGHSITAAPLAIDGKIIVGISGGEAGIRGFLDAYDAATGKQLWRFWTVPSPGEPGSQSWPGDSWVHGGGATWLTGSYDSQLKLLYWGTGNPGPDWNGDSRIGDNYGTSSVVALDIETGKLRWTFQFTPHDVHDWDANQIPVLADVDINGRTRQTLLMANRNGFFY